MSAQEHLLPGDWSERAKDLLLAALVAIASFVVYVNSPVLQSTDSRWTLHVAQSLIREGNLDLDEYVERGLIDPDNYRVIQIGGHIYSSFPLGTPLLSVLPVALYRVVGPTPGPDAGALSREFEMQVASAVISICVAVIYGIGRISLDRLWSVFLAGIFAVGTSAWSTASRALWQHGPSMLMLSLTLYIVLLAEKRPKRIVWAGLPLAYAYVIRPTNSISVVCLTVYILVRHREYILGFLGLAAAVAVPFAILNLTTYHALLPAYYMPSWLGTNKAFLEAMAANLVSPARGLFVYSPVLLASLGGVLVRVRKGHWTWLDVTLGLIVILHLVAVSSFPHWWAGHAFGPRFMADIVPYMVYLAIPVLAEIPRANGLAGLAVAVPLGVLALGSFYIHYLGATSEATYEWNRRPVNVDQDPTRIWDWRDPAFLRAVTRLDLLIPPLISLRPAQVYVVSQPGDWGFHRTSLELRETRYKRFQWLANVPSGVAVSPLQGNGSMRYDLYVTVLGKGYPPGRNTLGEIEIWAKPDRRQGGRGVLTSVPIEIYVQDNIHSVYLPLVPCGDGGS